MAEKMEDPSRTGDFDTGFRLIRYALNGHWKPEFDLRDTTGQLIAGQHRKIERWAEHFGQLLNRPVHQTATPPSCAINYELPSVGEITDVANQLKNEGTA